jgi:hypothetical protein
LHDFNPGITPNGVFWIVQVPDSAVQISGDALTIHLENIAVVDQFQFPSGTGNVPATVSFDITYTKSGMPRRVHPTSHDPFSPFNWAGKMWMATNSGTFSVAYNDGSFSAQGSFSSSGMFGEMGTERNGSFVGREEGDVEGQLIRMEQGRSGTEVGRMIRNEDTGLVWSSPRLKGRVPLRGLTPWNPAVRNRGEGRVIGFNGYDGP